MGWGEFVGIPYKWRGYGMDGADCWGLLCLVQADLYGRALPRHDAPVRDRREAGIWHSGIKVHPIQMDEARAGDVLHMRGVLRGALTDLHVGTFVDRRHVLHTDAASNSIIENVRSAAFQWRPLQAYRFD